MTIIKSTKRCANQHGVGLIEILISLVVVAVAILGLVGLQTLALKNNAEAQAITQVNLLANDIIERMRTNSVQAVSGSGYIIEYDTSLSSDLTCTSACTAAQMAEFDSYQWQQKVLSTLPGGQANIQVTPLATTPVSATVTINIRYLHSNSESLTAELKTSLYETFTFSARL
jgi:type IV pilus assembly protein PilV